jgi:Cleavage and polyadenylation factor 2 C-terminal
MCLFFYLFSWLELFLTPIFVYFNTRSVSFEVREEAVGIGQADSTARYGLAESIGRSGEVLEDDYGIAVLPERFTDIVSGVDPSKFSATGRIGDEVLRRGFGYGVTGPKKPKGSLTGPGGTARVSEDEDLDDSDELDEKALEAVDLSEGKGIIRGRGGRHPTKVTTIPRRVEVLAEVSYVPLEGRVDAQSSRQSVRALQPRHVIVMGGPSPKGVDKKDLVDEVSLLAEAAASFATGDAEIFTPSNGETAELSVGHAAYAVRLIDTPYRTSEEKESGEPAPPPIEPYETKLGACTVSLLDYVATGQKVALDGSIVLAPRAKPKNDFPSIYLSAGEVLLTDLRSELIAQGMKAEYSSHKGYSQLLVNGRVILRKDQGTGRMHVEGPLCEDFWTVRQIVIGQYGLL